MTCPKAIVILGSGGHATSIIDAIGNMPGTTVAGVLDNGETDPPPGVSRLGGDEKLPELPRLGIKHFIVGIGHQRLMELREQLFRNAQKAGLDPIILIHSFSAVSKQAHIGSGTAILAGACINPLAHIGENVIVNTNSTIEHHCSVGNHSHVAPGAILCGNAKVGERCHIGAGAVLLQGITVHDDAVVGAGTIVTKDVKSGCTVIGNPARPIN